MNVFWYRPTWIKDRKRVAAVIVASCSIAHRLHLILTNSSLTHVSSQSFVGLHWLGRLLLNNNSLTSIPPRAFTDLTCPSFWSRDSLTTRTQVWWEIHRSQ